MHDFAFDPQHFELLLVTSAFDGNIIDFERPAGRVNNYSCNVTAAYLNAAQIRFKNLVRYHPASYTTAVFYPDFQQLTLTDLSSTKTFYCSPRLFPSSAGLFDIAFSPSGDYLIVASSLYGCRLYSTKSKV